MSKSSENKKPKKAGKIVLTIFTVIITVVSIGIMGAANTLLKSNLRMANAVLGSYGKKTIDNSKLTSNDVDLEYNKCDYTKDNIKTAEYSLRQRISEEGIVLLRNDASLLPFYQEKTLSLFSVNSTKISEGGNLIGMGGKTLKQMLEDGGVKVNDSLWNFYTSDKCKNYGLAKGSVSFGDAEDFRINECPLNVLQSDTSVIDSLKGTVPVYVFKRVAGEGRDMPRSMYNHAVSEEDKVKSYLEPDTAELEILQYLNDNFDNTILLVNTYAAVELGWLDNFKNIKTVLYVPSGFYALGDILTGKVNPSGRLVDTFARDVASSPAAVNFGDFMYYNEDGTPTKYNYVSYKEGIYVGYKYYETRYEDVVLNQGNAGNFDYSKEVIYPFGYGLSYTSFDWSDFNVSWSNGIATATVTVTNTGKTAGKDVVELYVQSPYTDYDRVYNVEKASVSLAGYAKTKLLNPGESQKLIIVVSEEQLKSYDYTNAKTYILDAGNYYLTVAANAHQAINNVLAAKGVDNSRLTGKADASLTSLYTPDITTVDTVKYSKDSYSGAEITNLFDEANGGFTYLSRKDWINTWPTVDGKPSDMISTWGNEINGKDNEGKPASYTWCKTISKEDLEKLDSFDSRSPVDPSSINVTPVYGAKNGLTLACMRGLEFDDPLWESFLDQFTAEDYHRLIGVSGYGIGFTESVNQPFCLDVDTAAGLYWGGTGVMYPGAMTLAMTWNKELALEYGLMIGNEALIGGADGWYAPSMNIHRTPYSGRNGEYYSEDGFISGTVASCEVQGAASKGMYTYIKHFAFNDQENHRGDRDGQYSVATWLNEQSAREIYLLPFEMCMKVGDVDLNYVKKNTDGTYSNAVKKIRASQAVMTAFNRLGYTWTGANYYLLTGLLRNEWAFNGLILTDNANTGVFMDGYQMIEAGGDAKLTALEASARFDFDKDNPAHYYYGRKAIKHIMYTIANSKVTNRAMDGSRFVNTKGIGDKMILAVNIVCPLLILLMISLTVIKWHTYNKKKREADK